MRYALEVGERNRSAALARAFDASISRSRGGALVTREASSSRAALATWSTARSKAGWFALEGRVKPLSFRTNCREDARISSSVAGGLKLCSVLILRHMSLLAPQIPHRPPTADRPVIRKAGGPWHTSDAIIKPAPPPPRIRSRFPKPGPCLCLCRRRAGAWPTMRDELQRAAFPGLGERKPRHAAREIVRASRQADLRSSSSTPTGLLPITSRGPVTGYAAATGTPQASASS